MPRILLLIAVAIFIGLIISRWIVPAIYKIIRKDSFKIKKDLDNTDKNYD